MTNPTRPIADLMRDGIQALELTEKHRWTSQQEADLGLRRLILRAKPDADPKDVESQSLMTQAAASWAWCGFPRITMSHKHAALLMCTDVPVDLVPEIPMPWTAFLLDVPSGLIMPERPAGEAPGRVDHMLLWRSAGIDTDCFMVNGLFGAIEGMFRVKRALGPDSKAGRLAKPAARYVLGACIEIDRHRPSGMLTGGGHHPKLNARNEPVTRTYALRRDVKIDCRSAVLDYLRGTRSSVKIRSMVRGHWKHQPCGPERSERKFIHIEPYWRGPDDAPIALRNHVLAAKS